MIDTLPWRLILTSAFGGVGSDDATTGDAGLAGTTAAGS